MSSIESFLRRPDNEIRGVENLGSPELLSNVLKFINSNDKAKSLWEKYKGFFIEKINSGDYIVPFFYFFITIYLLAEEEKVPLEEVTLEEILNTRLNKGVEMLEERIKSINSENDAIENAEGLVRSYISTDAAEFILNIQRVWETIFNSSEELRQALENLYT
ncbi:MAG: hypothetical protein ACO2OW_00645 [Minisyncoccia bacterium]